MSRYFITFAGLPPTIAKGGTSFVTTEPAATIAPSPILTFPTINTLFPSHTQSPIVMFFLCMCNHRGFLHLHNYGFE